MPPRRNQYCYDIVDCFEEYVKRFLIFISVALCAVAAMLVYILKLMINKNGPALTRNPAQQPAPSQQNSQEQSNIALHNTDTPDGSPDRLNKDDQKPDEKKGKKKEYNKAKKGFFGTKNNEVKSAMTVQVSSTTPGCESSMSVNEILKDIGFDHSPKMTCGSTSDMQPCESYYTKQIPYYTTSDLSLFSQTKSSNGDVTPSNACSVDCARPAYRQNASCDSLRSNFKSLIIRPPPYYKRLLLIPPPSPSVLKSLSIYEQCSKCALEKQSAGRICPQCRNPLNN